MEGSEDPFLEIKVRKRKWSRRLLPLQSWVEVLSLKFHSPARDPSGSLWGKLFFLWGWGLGWWYVCVCPELRGNQDGASIWALFPDFPTENPAIAGKSL